jgi:rsbT co-antagonist protein RsbR
LTSQLTTFLSQQKAQITAALLDMPAVQRLRARSEEERYATVLASLDGLIGMLGQTASLREQMLVEMAQTQMRDGLERDDALALLDAHRETIYRALAEADLPAGRQIAAIKALEDLSHQSARTIVDTYHLETIEQLQAAGAAQAALREAIQELSIPIIPVYNGVLVVPLVGRVDSARAQALTEALLEAIAREQAEIVLLDITGVAVVDTRVANHLMQTARAASLLGSQVVLVGISAEVAQTLVQLGLDLGHLVTLSNLQSGIEYALAQQNLAIMAQA